MLCCSRRNLSYFTKRTLAPVGEESVVFNLYIRTRCKSYGIYFIRNKAFDRAIIFFALRSTMLHLVYLLLTLYKFDIFGCRQIRRDLVATVSWKVGRLPLPDIISTNVPRSWTLCKCSSRRNSLQTNFVKRFSSQSLLKSIRCKRA